MGQIGLSLAFCGDEGVYDEGGYMDWTKLKLGHVRGNNDDAGNFAIALAYVLF